jgi:hypothetical protein
MGKSGTVAKRVLKLYENALVDRTVRTDESQRKKAIKAQMAVDAYDEYEISSLNL